MALLFAPSARRRCEAMVKPLAFNVTRKSMSEHAANGSLRCIIRLVVTGLAAAQLARAHW